MVQSSEQPAHCTYNVPFIMTRGVGRWFGKGGLYRSIVKGSMSMISVYKIEPSYVTIRKHRGAPAPGAPMVPTPTLSIR